MKIISSVFVLMAMLLADSIDCCDDREGDPLRGRAGKVFLWFAGLTVIVKL